MRTICNRTVYWWDGEYEGECRRPLGHDAQPHDDGVSRYDDDGNPYPELGRADDLVPWSEVAL